MTTETQKQEAKEIFAFPLMPTQELWERGVGVEFGMTLRDYFAAKALQIIVENNTSGIPENFHQHYSEAAYAFADAMMKARSKTS